ncbi:MAG TPA: hypothetical protein PKC76_18980 [Saprospiraceae bacterium]|nr:hypothetical protein [Saprospiraceae bacterium]HMP26221.1 hypothetical protein [Saprospiraceae bacterium]
MPTLDRLKFDLKKMIADNFGNVLKKLERILKPDSSSYNTLLVLAGEFKQWNNRQMQNVQSQETLTQESNNLKVRLMDLIDSLEEKDVLSAFSLQEEIFEKILVVCKQPERKSYMKRFFPEAYFMHVAYDDATMQYNPENYDIIIFDDHPFDSKDKAEQLLRRYLNTSKPYVLYFGNGQSSAVREHPEKAYFSNSVFSLHARLFEMLNYLKYTRATAFHTNVAS